VKDTVDIFVVQQHVEPRLVLSHRERGTLDIILLLQFFLILFEETFSMLF
jgi:hypothetical protein